MEAKERTKTVARSCVPTPCAPPIFQHQNQETTLVQWVKCCVIYSRVRMCVTTTAGQIQNCPVTTSLTLATTNLFPSYLCERKKWKLSVGRGCRDLSAERMYTQQTRTWRDRHSHWPRGTCKPHERALNTCQSSEHTHNNLRRWVGCRDTGSLYTPSGKLAALLWD